MAETRVMTVDEVAELLRVSRNSCYEAIHRGEIPHVRIGKRIVVPRAAIERMLEGTPAQAA